MDGDCLIHTLMDQMSYDDQYSAFKTDPLTLRVMIVNSLKTLPSNKNLEWPISNNVNDGNRETWSEKMKQSGVQSNLDIEESSVSAKSSSIRKFPLLKRLWEITYFLKLFLSFMTR